MMDHVRIGKFPRSIPRTFYPTKPCASCQHLNDVLRDVLGRVLDHSSMVTYNLNGTSFILGMVTLGWVIYALVGIEVETGFFREWFGWPHLCWRKP